MNTNETWERALNNTEVIRPRIKPLEIYDKTVMPYIFLGESCIHENTTVVRKGQVVVDKPTLILPPSMPQLDGFDFESEKEVMNFLFFRGIHFPSMKYNNKVSYLDIYDDRLAKAEAFYRRELQSKEDIKTGLVIGPEDCWQFSVLIFVCMMASRSAERDIERLMQDL